MEQRVRLQVEDQLVEEELARRRAERDATSSKAAPPAPPPVPEEPRQRQRQQSEWRYPWATSVLHIVDPDTEQRLERSQLREVAPDRELQCAVYTELALPPVSGRRHDVTYTEASATQWVGAKLEVGMKKGSVDVEARLVGRGYHSYGRACKAALVGRCCTTEPCTFEHIEPGLPTYAHPTRTENTSFQV